MSTQAANDARAEFDAVTARPYYECNSKGVFYIALKEENGRIITKDPEYLASPIHLIGRGTDTAGNHYRVIQWRDTLARENRIAALPMAEIGGNWAKLQGMGIMIKSSRRKRELLADYLQQEGLQTAYMVTGRAGWTDNAYILPSGEILTAAEKPPRIIYNGDKSQAAAYTQSGSLKDWQDNIARYMTGNSRLALAIGTAFAAPLMHLLDIEAGGFHLFGDSRDGKSTAARAALSVWGNPAAMMMTWTGTSYGFSNAANARNDSLMVLDEIWQANPRHVSLTAYSVINGINKLQGAKDGGNREISRWRVLLLSTGEKPLDGFLQAARTDWNAGQAARLPSIPSNAGHGLGIFNTLHGFSKGSHLSEAINQAAARYHGTAGAAFVRVLLEKSTTADEAHHMVDAFMRTLPDMDGQARTVALRFALVAAALELAARHGITGIDEGLAYPAIKECFEAWAARTGTGKFEDGKIIENAISFMQQFAHSHRFMIYPHGALDRTPPELAGYRRTSETEQQDNFYILPAIFQAEICQTFDKGKVCEVLHAADWLKKYETISESRWQHRLKGKGWFYLLIGSLPPDSEADV